MGATSFVKVCAPAGTRVREGDDSDGDGQGFHHLQPPQ
jgi:hypothetical protein